MPVPDTKIFEQDRIHLLLLEEAVRGLDDLAAGRTKDAREAILAIKTAVAKPMNNPQNHKSGHRLPDRLSPAISTRWPQWTDFHPTDDPRMIDFNDKGFFKLKQNGEYAERARALLLNKTAALVSQSKEMSNQRSQTTHA